MVYGHEIISAPVSAPPARFKINDIAIIHFVLPDEKDVFCPSTVKAISWNAELNSRILFTITGKRLEEDNPFKYNWLAENNVNLLKPMYNIGEHIRVVMEIEVEGSVVAACAQFATIVDMYVNFDFDNAYGIFYKLAWDYVMFALATVDEDEYLPELMLDGGPFEGGKGSEKYKARLAASDRERIPCAAN